MKNREKNKVHLWSTIIVIFLIAISIGIYVYISVTNHLWIEESATLISVGSIIAFFALIFDVWNAYSAKKAAVEAIDRAEDAIKDISSPKRNYYVNFYHKLRHLQSKIQFIVDKIKDNNGLVLSTADQEGINGLYQEMYDELKRRGDIYVIIKTITPLAEHNLRRYKKEHILDFAEPLLEELAKVEKSIEFDCRSRVGSELKELGLEC